MVRAQNTQLHITLSQWLMQLPALSRAVTAVPSCRVSATAADRCSLVRWRLPHFSPKRCTRAPGSLLAEPTARPDLNTPALSWKLLGSCSIPVQRLVISLLNKNSKISPANLLKSRGLTPGCSLLVQSCSYRRASCPLAPGPQQSVPLHGGARPGQPSGAQGACPGGSASAPPCCPVEPAVVFGKLLGRSASEGQPWGSPCRVCRRSGVEAAGWSRSQVLPGTSPSPPIRPPPPGRQVSGRAAARRFSSTSWRKCCATHASHAPCTQERPLEPSRAPTRDGPRSAR